MLTPGVLENDPLVEDYGRLTRELNLRVQVKCMGLLKVDRPVALLTNKICIHLPCCEF